MRARLLPLLGLLLVGCGSPSVVGRWESTTSVFPTQLEFRADGSYEQSMTRVPNGLTVVEKGTYAQSGKELNWKAASIVPDRNVTPQQKRLIDEMPRTGRATLDWDGSNGVTLLFAEGPTLSFKRR